jgi:hypothetical protein
MSDEIDVTTISPTDYNLPSTHVVQALSNHYIYPLILETALEASWPKDWQVILFCLKECSNKSTT